MDVVVVIVTVQKLLESDVLHGLLYGFLDLLIRVREYLRNPTSYRAFSRRVGMQVSLCKAPRMLRMMTGLHPVLLASTSLVTFIWSPYSARNTRQCKAMEYFVLSRICTPPAVTDKFPFLICSLAQMGFDVNIDITTKESYNGCKK